MSLTKTRLFDGDLLAVRHVRCRPSGCEAGGIEHAEADTLILPLHGVFFKHLSPRERVVAEPTQALLFAAGRAYRISHPGLGGDDCLVLQFSPDALRDALAATAGVDTLHDGALLPQAALSPAAVAARKLLAGRLAQRMAGGLEVEETSFALLACIIAAARRLERPLRTRPQTRERRREQTDSVRALLLASPGGRWTLPELARGVHTSPFHLTRVFRQETGLALHEYHLRVRLAAGLDRLLDTDQPLSAIALDLGFATQSHFTLAFRRMLGVTPHRFRRSARTGQVREVRTILIDRLRGGV